MSKKNKSQNKNPNKNKQISTEIINTEGVVWNLEPMLLGKSMEQWIKIINSNVEKFKKYREILNDKITPVKLLEIIKLEEEISIAMSRLNNYYELKFNVNSKDSQILAKISQINQINADISNEILFFGLWLIHLDDKIAEKLSNSKELIKYKYFIQDARKSKKYVKSEEIEQILNIKDITGRQSYVELYHIITGNYSFEWKGKKITQEALTSNIRSNNPQDREEAYKKLLGRHIQDKTLLSQIYKDIVLSWYNEGIKIRKYDSSISIKNVANDVSDKSVDTLFKVVRKNTKIFQEYFKIKYELNKKLDETYPYSRYHLYAPLKTKLEKKYSYEESLQIVLDTFKKFHPKFYECAKKIIDDKHVHSHPAVGKRGGAFCASTTITDSPYILLNHTNDIRDVFTIMHEFGHGIHYMLAAEKQPNMLAHASLPMCETASIFSEMILNDRMLKESKNNDEKKSILTKLLDDQFATILRQTYFVIFEKLAHEKIVNGAATEEIIEIYKGLVKEQFGEMIVPEEFNIEWLYLHHIFDYPFYCYAYSWGNLFVLGLYDMYRKEGNTFKEKYINLLSSGGNGSPAELMKKLGADPESEEFWQRGFNIIKEEIEELKKLK